MREFIVYSMSIQAREELAMVLPIPVKLRSREDAVRFINLKKYPNFFDDLENGFQVPVSAGALSARATSPSTKGLAVQVVALRKPEHVPVHTHMLGGGRLPEHVCSL